MGTPPCPVLPRHCLCLWCMCYIDVGALPLNWTLIILAPQPPTTVSISATEKTGVFLVSWVEPTTPGIEKYKIWYKKSDNWHARTPEVSAPAKEYKLTLGDAKPGQVLRLKVQAISSMRKKSDWSNEVQFTVPDSKRKSEIYKRDLLQYFSNAVVKS